MPRSCRALFHRLPLTFLSLTSPPPPLSFSIFIFDCRSVLERAPFVCAVDQNRDARRQTSPMGQGDGGMQTAHTETASFALHRRTLCLPLAHPPHPSARNLLCRSAYLSLLHTHITHAHTLSLVLSGLPVAVLGDEPHVVPRLFRLFLDSPVYNVFKVSLFVLSFFVICSVFCALSFLKMRTTAWACCWMMLVETGGARVRRVFVFLKCQFRSNRRLSHDVALFHAQFDIDTRLAYAHARWVVLLCNVTRYHCRTMIKAGLFKVPMYVVSCILSKCTCTHAHMGTEK